MAKSNTEKEYRKGSQKDMILKALKKGMKLTPLDAWIGFGCSKLSTRLCEIEKEKRIIFKHRMIEVKTKFGKKHVMQYSL